MILIREESQDIQTVVEESKEEGKKSLYITGPFMQAEVKNRNGRIYPRSVMESALNIFQKLIEDKRSIGELSHPSTPTVNPERASHIITELKFDGNDVYGKARILESMPMGKIVKSLIDEGVKIGVSSRAMGSLRNVNGVNYVQPDLVISTIDVVSDPSGPSCFVNGIMEGRDWIYEASSNSWIIAEQIKKQAQNNKNTLEKQIKYFQYFLENIK